MTAVKFPLFFLVFISWQCFSQTENIKWLPLEEAGHFMVKITDSDLNFSPGDNLYLVLYNREGQCFVQYPQALIRDQKTVSFLNVFSYEGIKEAWLVSPLNERTLNQIMFDTEFELRQDVKILAKYVLEKESTTNSDATSGNRNLSDQRRNEQINLSEFTNRIANVLNSSTDTEQKAEMLDVLINDVLKFFNLPFIESTNENILFKEFKKQIQVLTNFASESKNVVIQNYLFQLLQFTKQNQVFSLDDIRLRIKGDRLENSFEDFISDYDEALQKNDIQIDKLIALQAQSKIFTQSLGLSPDAVEFRTLEEIQNQIKKGEVILSFFIAGSKIKSFVIEGNNVEIIDLCEVRDLEEFFDFNEATVEIMHEKYNDEFLKEVWYNIEKHIPEDIGRIYVAPSSYFNMIDLAEIQINGEPIFMKYEFANFLNPDFLFTERNKSFEEVSLAMVGDITYSEVLMKGLDNGADKMIKTPQLNGQKEFQYFCDTLFKDRCNPLKGVISEIDFKKFWEQTKEDIFLYSGHGIGTSDGIHSSALLLSAVNKNINIQERLLRTNQPNPEDGVLTTNEMLDFKVNNNVKLVFLSSCFGNYGQLTVNNKPMSMLNIFKAKTNGVIISTNAELPEDYAYRFCRTLFSHILDNEEIDLVSAYNSVKKELYKPGVKRGNFVLTL